jgi:formylmethanofuran dehydrogenase subunit E
MKTLSIDPTTADLSEMIERGTALHGHLGPFLVAGIRMGLLALSLLGSPGYFGVRARSEAGRTTPLSCLNDGIQIGSGCTTGKGNLEVVDGAAPRARFETAAQFVVIELREEVMRSFPESDTIEKARDLESLTIEELLTWTSPSSR